MFTPKVLILDRDNQHTNPAESNSLSIAFPDANWGFTKNIDSKNAKASSNTNVKGLYWFKIT
jgi:hypothetical protein